MEGLKPAVVGLIGASVLSIASTVFFGNGVSAGILTSPEFLISLGIFAVMLILAFRKVHPILIIALSAAVGIGAGFVPGIGI